MILSDKIKKDVLKWNRRFPIDRWWREKYKIPFLSEEHKKSSFLQQYYEYVEDSIFAEVRNKTVNEKEIYIPNIGEFFKTSTYQNRPMTFEEEVAAWRKENNIGEEEDGRQEDKGND